MESISIADKKAQIFEAQTQVETILSEEVSINELLDHILETRSWINKLNDAYAIIFKLVDDISRFKSQNFEEFTELEDVISALHITNTSASKLFAQLNKVPELQEGCKIQLMDFRINVRNLRESLVDLEELFFLEEEDPDLDDLMGQFA